MIRSATLADIPAMLQIYAPYVLHTGYSFEYAVPTEEEFARRLTHHIHYCPWFVWEENGQVLGYAYGAPAFERAAYSWCAEVSVYLAPQVQGKGVGRKLYAALETVLFRLGYRVIYAIITTENAASIAFHQALGYEKRAEFPGCGIKFGREMGTVWLEKRSAAEGIPAAMPTAWEEVVKTNEKLSDILANLSLS